MKVQQLTPCTSHLVNRGECRLLFAGVHAVYHDEVTVDLPRNNKISIDKTLIASARIGLYWIVMVVVMVMVHALSRVDRMR